MNALRAQRQGRQLPLTDTRLRLNAEYRHQVTGARVRLDVVTEDGQECIVHPLKKKQPRVKLLWPADEFIQAFDCLTPDHIPVNIDLFKATL